MNAFQFYWLLEGVILLLYLNTTFYPSQLAGLNVMFLTLQIQMQILRFQ